VHGDWNLCTNPERGGTPCTLPCCHTSLPPGPSCSERLCGGDRVARHRLPSKCLWISSTELVVPGDDSFTELLFDQMNALTVDRQLEVTR